MKPLDQVGAWTGNESSDRFIKVGNDILDKETLLVWTDVDIAVGDWFAAKSQCVEYYNGRRGWRLPTVAELSSLYTGGVGAVTIDPRFVALTPLPGMPSNQPRWTATILDLFDVDNSSQTWVLNPYPPARAWGWSGTQFTAGFRPRVDSLRVQCVRGYTAGDGN
jgi:hypothetical protein